MGAALLLLYAGWAAAFVAATAVPLGRGRVFCLFDDAMISMRYAWNLAHGRGLVFNVGERVEGFSNPLSVALMAVAATLFDRSHAVLAVQVMGIATVLAAALVAFALARRLVPESPLAGLAAAVAVLGYYPLSFWSLMGMETGLVTLLLAWATLAALPSPDLRETGKTCDGPRRGLGLALVGLALVRPDGLVPVAVILGFRVAEHGRARRPIGPVLLEALPVALTVVALTGFRMLYFVAPVPNTYTLKIAGVPLGHRWSTGLEFAALFAASAWLALLLAAWGAWRPTRPGKGLLSALVLAALAYTVWTGGDPWPYWRTICPVVPHLALLAWDGASDLAGRARRLGGSLPVAASLQGACLVASLLQANAGFAREALLRALPFSVGPNRANVADALTLRWICRPTASVGVLWAGALPYYADLHAVDFLGKTDARIAALPADPTLTVNGLANGAGHNKYDLDYSIGERRPDVVQVLRWGRNDLGHLAGHTYVPFGEMWLRRDSAHLRWDRLPPALRTEP